MGMECRIWLDGFVVLYERPPFFVTDQTFEDALCVDKLL